MKSARLVLSLIALGSFGCAARAAHPDEAASELGGTDDLGVGSIEGEEGVASTEDALGNYGAATTCKPIPVVEPLRDPEIVISLDGLTLHLRDRAGAYDRVFPIGPGALEDGKSKTPIGQFYTGSDTHEVKDAGWGYFYPCKIWWTDPDTKKQSPVFAGLPFIRLAGTPTAGYGIHGPIDGYTAANGGALRRGYVSHGCVRTAASDVVEIYGRIHARPRTPVRIQQAVERRSDGALVTLVNRWVGEECQADTDCSYAGGLCRKHDGATVGVCTAKCTHGCSDRVGEVPTFCVSDGAGGGMCVPQASPTWNATCARYESREAFTAAASRPDHSALADVCAPN